MTTDAVMFNDSLDVKKRFALTMVPRAWGTFTVPRSRGRRSSTRRSRITSRTDSESHLASRVP